MEDKNRNIDSEEVREYVGMQQDNYIFEKQLKTNTIQLIGELAKYDLTFDEPKKHKIPFTKRAKWSINKFFNKISNVFGQ